MFEKDTRSWKQERVSEPKTIVTILIVVITNT